VPGHWSEFHLRSTKGENYGGGEGGEKIRKGVQASRGSTCENQKAACGFGDADGNGERRARVR